MPADNDIPLAWTDLEYMYRLAGHRLNYASGSLFPAAQAHAMVGYWAQCPLAQWLLRAKIDGSVPVGDGAVAWNKACREATGIQVRVLAAFNDAAVQRRDILLTP